MILIGDREYEFIRQLVYEQSRIHLGDNKKELVTGRLNKRLRALQFESYAEYCALLKSPAGLEELTDLVNVISTNFTHFFREIKHFNFMKEAVLSEFNSKTAVKKEEEFRVWSAASSTGEEPYSIAIMLTEFFGALNRQKWVVEATDISTRALGKAAHGIYESSHVKLPHPEWLRRYFQHGVNAWQGSYRVKAEVRARVNFQHLNLLQLRYPFQRKFHVVFCRNVMIYFDRPTQEQLVAKLTEQLIPGGYLFVGHSESLTGVKHSLKGIKPSIYQKLEMKDEG